METSSHCIVSKPHARFDLLWLIPLTLFVLLVHGYHPWAEDGGMYVAGVEYTLHPSLFPHETAFATAQLRYSLFAHTVAGLVRLSHLTLPAVLFSLYLLSIALTLFAGHAIARKCFRSAIAQWTAVTLLAAWWTLPIAATSLLLMDPYVTARSLSTPLSLLAVDAALVTGPHRPRGTLRSAIFLGLAALVHPLMAGYALGFVLCLRLVLDRATLRVWMALIAIALLLAAILQIAAGPESSAALAADHSRYYWFLAQWHAYEWLGLLAPLALFALLAHRHCRGSAVTALCRASLISGAIGLAIALVFGQEHYAAHPVARLQPLRSFLLPYALMILLLAGTAAERLLTLSQRARTPARKRLLKTSPLVIAALLALPMYLTQRANFPSSVHLELPGRANPNPWTQAFLWARDGTPADALFALDARYVNTPGEDAQTFRALSLRSAIPDFSKDGGEAANQPALAAEWERSALATRDLSALNDATRDARLHPFAVTWLVLHADAPTAHPCPYTNAVVKVCELR